MLYEVLHIIKEDLHRFLVNSGFPSIKVELGSIAGLNSTIDRENTNEELNDRLMISLIRVEEAPGYNNISLEKLRFLTADAKPQIRLNLYLLFAGCSLSYERALQHISKVMEFFFNKNVFILSPENRSYNPELDVQEHFEFTAELYSPTFEELHNIWGASGSQQFLSVIYKLRLSFSQSPSIFPFPQENEINEQFLSPDANEAEINNAGLVLLHPFLTSFLKNIGVLDEQKKIIQAYSETAVYALNYLVREEAPVIEEDMAFEKYLCNVPLKSVLTQQKAILSDSIMQEIKRTLNEVIDYWPALKHTSHEVLRDNFLKRSGKLVRKNENFELIVEGKSQDVLLNKIPWNMSIVKLPWKKELLFVSWL